MAGPAKRRGGISVDFTGVESGGGRAVPDGDYLLEVVGVEEKESGDGNPYLAWKWKIAEGPLKGATIYDNTSLQPQALWRLKTLLECMGVEAAGKMSLNPEAYKGKFCGASVANETYQGKQKPRISGFLDKASLGASAAKSGPTSSFKKGTKVSFEFEGETLTGVIQSLDGNKAIVLTQIDGNDEEWELPLSEVQAQ